MQTIRLPGRATATAWRDAARGCLAQGLQPEEVVWAYGGAAPDLFAPDMGVGSAAATTVVPRSFIRLAGAVVWHRDPERFAWLYTLLWRVKDRPALMDDQADPLLARLRAMQKAVYRCQHKMKAFVRFREIGAPDAERRSFAAWFEPAHYTLEPTAPFFASRFGDMDWRIVTPDLTATFEDGALGFADGQSKPPLPEDAAEELWATYFRNIFNPSRLKVKAMQTGMPKSYWRNMPETRQISDMIAGAEGRAQAMRAAAPTAPPARAARLQNRRAGLDRTSSEEQDVDNLNTIDAVHSAARSCTRCPLYRNATQVVMGEGPTDAELMLVGEQPGDQEDLAGRPFVGPAGQILDRVCHAAGIDRSTVYVTNAVKHFKFLPRGKRRLHQKPDAGEIVPCRWWLDLEMRLVQPRLIVALGATAAESLTGTGKGILRRRGAIEHTEAGTPVFLTIHPSYLLRLPDAATKAAETDSFRRDLEAAAAHLQELRAGRPNVGQRCS
ncbi:MAG: UdgX family uracil-DNA binding protein [Rhodospirillales bacterium]|nr:UdgX family uracil-DNA binding protein [Rhodospirillales bacterium]